MWRRVVMASRIVGVEGVAGCTNDVVYCSPLHHRPDEASSTVVFFPGDVQNYPELMKQDSENLVYLKWNLMETALMLQSYFKRAHVCVVKPSRTEFDVYSCYDSFIHCDRFGTPQKECYVKALPQLEALLINTASRVLKDGITHSSDIDKSDIIDWDPSENGIELIGFSKGCVVLNQLVYEIAREAPSAYLKGKIKKISWLDGGHGGTSGAWITNSDILSSLASLPLDLRVEVTPYQVERRDWVRREEKIFSDTLTKFSPNFRRRIHFASFPASLLNHFRILDALYSDTYIQPTTHNMS